MNTYLIFISFIGIIAAVHGAAIVYRIEPYNGQYLGEGLADSAYKGEGLLESLYHGEGLIEADYQGEESAVVSGNVIGNNNNVVGPRALWSFPLSFLGSGLGSGISGGNILPVNLYAPNLLSSLLVNI